jgi:hypothetical protein
MIKSSILLSLLTVLKMVHGYSYSKDAVYLLGENCFTDPELLDGTANHDMISNIENPNNDKSHIVTLNVLPGSMCYFETFSNFKVGGIDGLDDFEKENLAVYYFPYVGDGAGMFVNG